MAQKSSARPKSAKKPANTKKTTVTMVIIFVVVAALFLVPKLLFGGRGANKMVSDSFVNPKEWSLYDETIAAARTESDMAARKTLLMRAENILMASGGVSPQYYYGLTYLKSNHLFAVYADSRAYVYFRHAMPYDAATDIALELGYEPSTLDPTFGVDEGICFLVDLYSNLYTYNDGGLTENACAESYTVSDDGLTYTVTLKEGLRWSDGSPLTAEDFARSWQRAITGESLSAYLFEPIVSFEAVDARTFTFTLAEKCAGAEDLMTLPGLSPVKEGAEDSAKITNGAFFCREWVPGKCIVLEKNPYWYDAENVKVDSVTIRFYDDEQKALEAYLSGEVLLALSVPEEYLAEHAEDADVFRTPQFGTNYILFNLNDPRYADMKPEEAACLRTAVNLLIDRDRLCIRESWIGADSVVPLGMMDGNGGTFHIRAGDFYDITDRRTNKEVAGMLLKAAGYELGSDGKLSDKTPLTFTYLINENADQLATAEIVRESLAELGITVEIESASLGEVMGRLEAGDFDMARFGWFSDYNDPLTVLELFTTDSEYNFCGFGK